MDSKKKIKDIFKENNEGKLVLPNFQRGFEWKVNDQKKLLSSVISLLPIGSILLLEGEKGEFATRQLCYNDDVPEQKEACLYLLDGQQRTSSLRAIFSNLMGDKDTWEENYNKLFNDLKYRWFLDLKKNSSLDIFGYENLKFDKNNIRKFEPGQFIESITEIKITKQNRQRWFHPNFHKDTDGVEQSGIRLKNIIAKYASDEELLPLYDVYDSIHSQEKGVLEFTLDKIANERKDKLKAEVLDETKSLLSLLGHIEPDIEELVEKEEDFKDKIDYAWSSLATEWKSSILSYLKNILEQEMHVIQLPSEEISRATAIYESINKGGVSLNTYDLIVAKAARERAEKTLTQRIIDKLTEPIELSTALIESLNGVTDRSWTSLSMKTVEGNKISSSIRDQYLNMLSIFSHENYGVSSEIKIDYIKKDKQLELTPDQINNNTDMTIVSLIRACAFLQYRCGKVNINDLSYKLMLIPIAYALKSDDIWNSRSSLAKIEYWYWTSLFGGSYREKPNQRCLEDTISLYKWIKMELADDPFDARFSKVLNYEGYSTLEVLLNNDPDNKTPSAIYNAILEYGLSTQPKDFYPSKDIRLNAWDIAIEKKTVFAEGVVRELKINDHHIYPLGADLALGQSSRELRNDPKHILNSVLNRTYISDYSNSLIRDKLPSNYFQFLSQINIWNHSIESLEWQQRQGETAEECYERLLISRYNKLKEKIITELDLLRDVQDLQAQNS